VKQQPVDHPILVQDGSVAMLLTSGKLYPLDPASASEGAATSVDPKADAGSVAVGGGVVAVVGPGGAGESIRTGSSTGRTLHLDGPTYDVGGGSTVAVGSDGTVASYSPLTSQVTRLAPGSTEPTTSAADAGQAPQITVNNGRGVLLSSGSPRRLLIDDGHKDVEVGSVGSRVALQQMNLSHGPIALASEQGLFLVSTSGAMTTLWRSGSSAGAPVRPLVGVDGCVYGAWRGADPFEVMVCPGSSPVVRTLQAAKGWGTGGGSYQPGRLTFQAGSLGPALNDLASGDSFVMLDDNLFVVPWDQGSISNQTIPDRVLTPRNPQADHSIVATPDSLSARSGKVAQLAVLVNDYDAAGDVLSVESVTASIPGQQQFLHVTQGDSVTLDLSSAPIAVGQSLSFTYTVSNGRGQTASAPVTVKIVSSTDYTEAPVRRDSLQEPVIPARQGTIVRYDVVNDWYDPAGGPLSIKQATAVDGSDAVTWSPEGWLEIGPISGSTTAVNVVVANAGGTNSSYTVRLHLVSSADHPVAADDLAYGTVGEAMLLQPLHNDFSASGAPLELVASPQPLDQGSAPQLSLKNDGTLMVTPAKVGSYTYLYQAKDSQTQETSAQAYLRLVVTGAGAPPDAPAQSVQIPNLGGVTVDLLAAASNPNQGEPLVVTGFSVANSCPPGSGCTGVVGVIEQNRWLHLTDLGGPQGHAALVSYQVSNS
ncbi:MAG: Ig-like domain-containing protein, partial [Actinomycetes bacterium]